MLLVDSSLGTSSYSIISLDSSLGLLPSSSGAVWAMNNSRGCLLDCSSTLVTVVLVMLVLVFVLLALAPL